MRLFIAIDLPEEPSKKLAGLRAEIPGVSWVPPEQLHLTLSFLGEVAVGICAQLTAELVKIGAPGFDLHFTATGCFPDRRQPRVLWAGLAAAPRLIALAQQINNAVTICGISQEVRPFSPHITLARCRQPAGKEVGAFLDQQRRLKLPPFRVREFILFQSLLTAKGAIHTPLGQFPLHA